MPCRAAVCLVVAATALLGGCADDDRPRQVDDHRTPTTPSTLPDVPPDVAAFLASATPEDATFTATYEVLRKLGGVEATVEVVQRPPARRITVGDLVVLDGPHPATCRTSADRCIGEVREQQLAPFGLFSGFYSTGPRQAVSTVARRPDAAFEHTTRSAGGEPLDCLVVTVGAGVAGEWCLTADGVFGYADTPTLRFELRSYEPVADGPLEPPSPIVADDGFLTAGG